MFQGRFNQSKTAFGGMLVANAAVFGMFLFADVMANRAAPGAQPIGVVFEAGPTEGPIFIVTREFNYFQGWTAGEIADAIRAPFAALGVTVFYRPDLDRGGGLDNEDSLEFSFLVARKFHEIVGVRALPPDRSQSRQTMQATAAPVSPRAHADARATTREQRAQARQSKFVH